MIWLAIGIFGSGVIVAVVGRVVGRGAGRALRKAVLR